MPAPWLQPLDIADHTIYWLSEDAPFLIGRNEPAHLVIPSPRISRQHAHIVRTAVGMYELVDLGSQNGTFVNGRQLDHLPHALQDGDEIVLGGVAAFRFYDPDQTRKGPRIGRLQGVWLDETIKAVWVDAQLVDPPLSPAQYTLLQYLYHRTGQVVSRAEIVTAVWPDADPNGISEEAIDGLIKRLRQRLRQTQPQSEYVEVIRGHGLRLIHPLRNS
ncbi:MAG: FHA domain-containing protein [Anaerolineae bacterium]|nr:FHA domain-containing protein [Anaerolineae bacterium]